MKSLLFTAILSLRKRSEQILINFAILLQVRLTHAQTFFRGVRPQGLLRTWRVKNEKTLDILVHAQKRICLGADQFIAGVQIFHGLHEMKYFSLEVLFLAKIYV
jgi:hypothetical protein